MAKRISYKITGNHTDEVLDAMRAQALKALEMCGLLAEGYAIVNITEQKAVDTGLLRNSITHAIAGMDPAKKSYKANKGGKTGSYKGTEGKKGELVVYVGTNVEYAPYIEYGTGKGAEGDSGRQSSWTYKDKEGYHRTNGTKARPFIRPAVADHQKEYKQIIKDEMQN